MRGLGVLGPVEPIILRLRGRPGVVRGGRARGVDGVVLVWVRHALIMRHLPEEDAQIPTRTRHELDTLPARTGRGPDRDGAGTPSANGT